MDIPLQNNFLMKYKSLIKQLFMFGIIGCFGVVLDVVLYFLLLKIGLSIVVSKTISIIICVIYGYFMHSRYTFGAKRTANNMFFCFIVYGISIVQNAATNSFLVNNIKNQYNFVIAYLVATCISICISFFGMKFLVFTQKCR